MIPRPAEGTRAWIRELELTLSTHSQVVLHGGIRDLHLAPGPRGLVPRSLLDVLWGVADRAGYECLVVHDRVDGARSYPAPPDPRAPAARTAAERLVGRDQLTDRTDRLQLLRSVTATRPEDQGPPPVRALLLMDYASRLLRSPSTLDDQELALFSAAQLASHRSAPVPVAAGGAASTYNQVVWLVDEERDLPVWMTANNPSVRRISLPPPDLAERAAGARVFLALHPGHATAAEDVRRAAADRLAAATDGGTLTGVRDTVRLMVRLGTPIEEVEDAARSYRLGVVDTPWRGAHLRERLVDASSTLEERVIGQPAAVQRAVDIVTRAAMGMSGAQASSSTSRPRGVLFFAGPTGVGKTELARALTELVFGDEGAYLRFDMSEFSAEHASDRLIGAPPGYVGHGAGGELTNGVRQRPFCLVLFDEIEKAHPRILDKFLQILDDGRLTDGSGATTYFTEALLVFTSNLGVGGVPAGASPAEAEAAIREGVRHHFVEDLRRPELLNRLGDNIVVFDAIRPPVAAKILDHLVRRIVAHVRREHGVRVTLEPRARETLLEHACSDLSGGGRGIGSALESALVNPLARELFRRGATRGTGAVTEVSVTDVVRRDGIWSVELS